MTAPVRIPTYDPTNAGNRPGDGPLRVGGVATGLPQAEGNLPSTPSKAVKAQQPALEICRDLSGGNEKVKARGSVYLPQNPGEDPKNYSVRLARSVFFNVFGKTVEGLTGFVFAKDPILGNDVPAVIRGDKATDTTTAIEGHWENIDLAGTHGDVFCRDLLQDALTAGHAAILVEFPATGGAQRLDREVRGEIRPYWVPIKKDNIVSWRTRVEDGRLILSQLVLKECTMVEDGAFGEREQVRYRVLWNDNGVVGFSLLEITDARVVLEVASGRYPTQQEIPVAEIITSGRRSLFESQPPLLDLAFLNIAHYQQWSDYATSMHMTCVPILFLAGVELQDESGNTITVSANSAISGPPGSAAQYVSHDGAALGSVKQALDDLLSNMATMGLSMLAPQKRAAETAEAKRIDKSGSDSALGVTARGLQDGIERALGFHARYLRLPSGGSITINRSYDEPVMDAVTMSAYADLVDKLGLPMRVVLEALKRGGRIAEDTDLDDLEAEMEMNREAQEDARRQAEEQRLALAMGDLKAGGKVPPRDMAA